MALATFLSTTGIIGIICSVWLILSTFFDKKYLYKFSAIFVGSFILAANGFIMMDKLPKKKTTAQELALEEYYYCIDRNRSERDIFIIKMKTSVEKHCSEVNKSFEKNILKIDK